MITNKDKEYAAIMTKIWIRDSEGGQLEDLAGIISRIRTKSADQTRKEAAERVTRAWREHGEGITLRTLRTAILDDHTADHIHDTGEKLAIAVKALEKISRKGKASSAFDDHFSRLQDSCAFANDALREIQGCA